MVFRRARAQPIPRALERSLASFRSAHKGRDVRQGAAESPGVSKGVSLCKTRLRAIATFRDTRALTNLSVRTTVSFRVRKGANLTQPTLRQSRTRPLVIPTFSHYTLPLPKENT